MSHNSNQRNHHLAYCQICQYRDFDSQKGITCVLTKTIADFENECASMQIDLQYVDITKDQLLEILHFNRKDYLTRYERNLPDVI